MTRLRRILRRSGVELPISTLTDWVAYCGDLLEPEPTGCLARLSAAHGRTPIAGLDAK